MSFPAELDHPEYQKWLHALSTLEAEMQKKPRASNVEACLSTLTQQRFFPWQLSLLLGRLSLQALQKGGQQTKINTSINRAEKKIQQQLTGLPKAQVAKIFKQELAQLKADIAQRETHFTALEQLSHFYRPFVDAAHLRPVEKELAKHQRQLAGQIQCRHKRTRPTDATANTDGAGTAPSRVAGKVVTSLAAILTGLGSLVGKAKGSLVLHLPLNDTMPIDVGPNGIPCQVNGTNPINGAFDGASAVVCAAHPALDLPTELSIAFAARVDSDGAFALTGKDEQLGSDGNYRVYVVQSGGNSTLYFEFDNSGAKVQYEIPNQDFSSSRHFALTYSLELARLPPMSTASLSQSMRQFHL